MYDGHHWFGGGFMWLFWILLIVALFWGLKNILSNNLANTDKKKSALDILNDRYAKGEIDRKEYQQKRNDITNITE